MSIDEFTKALNKWGAQRVPFLFIIDFEMQKPVAFTLEELKSKPVFFDVNGFKNIDDKHVSAKQIQLNKFPINVADYKEKFDLVYEHLCYGDSYLANLTVKTEIDLNLSLQEVYHRSHAKYKLLYEDEFLVFSPETFVKIKDGKIYSYPMKGTIDASVPDAAHVILHDKKELAEHVTIVDLIRNDISQIASDVTVTRFRYIDELKTSHKNLLQVSSEIRGTLPDNFHLNLGDLLVKLLPAGSISGAPKPKTVEIIRQAEKEPRGYYTGVFGVYDGENLDSGVMIRFIEKHGNKFYYRSGGGITTQSVLHDEYQEVIDKVYVPVT